MEGWLSTVGMLVLTLALVLLRVATTARARRRGSGGDVVPLHRPVDQVGADLRRLHAAFHREGMRFAKYEGCRQAYDGVLAEAAEMAGCPHLMTVLPPGSELDRERERVERLLVDHGLLPPPYAA